MNHATLVQLRQLVDIGAAALVILVAAGWIATRVPLLLIRLGHPRTARVWMRLVARRRWPLPARAWERAETVALLWDGRFVAACTRARAMRANAETAGDMTAALQALEIELLAGLLQDRAGESRALFEEHRDDLHRRGALRHELTFGEPGGSRRSFTSTMTT